MNLLPAVKGSVDVATIDGLVARSTEIRQAASDPTELAQLIAELDVIAGMFRASPEAVGLAAIEAEKRRAETKLGELSRLVGRGRARGRGVPAKLESDSRRMAVNKPIVEQVIAASSDASPPTRRKVIKAIDAAEGKVAGRIVALQLSEATWQIVSARAEVHGESVGTYLTRQIDRMAARAEAKPAGRPAAHLGNPDRPGYRRLRR